MLGVVLGVGGPADRELGVRFPGLHHEDWRYPLLRDKAGKLDYLDHDVAPLLAQVERAMKGAAG